jgi:flavorubredoxin
VETLSKILIIHYSRSGKTEEMAKAIEEGARSVRGVEVELKRHGSAWGLADFDAILVGAPTYHHDMTRNIKEFLEEVAFHNIDLKDKIGAAFGSYGWSGEAPRMVLEIMENKFEMQVLKPPLLLKYKPDKNGLDKCRKLGKNVAKQVSTS